MRIPRRGLDVRMAEQLADRRQALPYVKRGAELE